MVGCVKRTYQVSVCTSDMIAIDSEVQGSSCNLVTVPDSCPFLQRRPKIAAGCTGRMYHAGMLLPGLNMMPQPKRITVPDLVCSNLSG